MAQTQTYTDPYNVAVQWLKEQKVRSTIPSPFEQSIIDLVECLVGQYAISLYAKKDLTELLQTLKLI